MKHGAATSSYVDGYVYGHLAGTRFFQEFQRNPDAKRPANPHQGQGLPGIEWERGFAEGLNAAQTKARKTALRRV